MELDEGEAKGNEDENEENPFDIDAMKEHQPSTSLEEEKEEPQEKEDADDNSENSFNLNDEKEIPEGVDEGCEENTDDKANENAYDNDNEKEDKNDNEVIPENDFRPSDDKPSNAGAQPAPETKDNLTMSHDPVCYFFIYAVYFLDL